jgi:hypothetical protein
MPGAGCTREPCVQKSVHFTHASNTGSAETTGIPRAMVLRLIARSPRSAGLDSLRRLKGSSPQGLIPASGDQDHTPSPSAPAHSSRAPPRPPHPAPRFVTTAKRLCSERGTGRKIGVIWVSGKAKYFCKQGLTGFRKIRPSGKSAEEIGGAVARMSASDMRERPDPHVAFAHAGYGVLSSRSQSRRPHP